MYVGICKDSISPSHFISYLCNVMHVNKIQFSYDLSGMTARDVTHEALLGMWLELQIQPEELEERRRSWILKDKNSQLLFC